MDEVVCHFLRLTGGLYQRMPGLVVSVQIGPILRNRCMSFSREQQGKTLDSRTRTLGEYVTSWFCTKNVAEARVSRVNSS